MGLGWVMFVVYPLQDMTINPSFCWVLVILAIDRFSELPLLSERISILL